MRDYDVRVVTYDTARGVKRAAITLGNNSLRRKYAGKRVDISIGKDGIVFKESSHGYKVTQSGVISVESFARRFESCTGIYPKHSDTDGFYILFAERQDDNAAAPFSKLGTHAVMPTNEEGRAESDRMGKNPELNSLTGYLKITDSKAFRKLFTPLAGGFTARTISKITEVDENIVNEFIDNLNSKGTGFVSEDLITGILSHFYSGNTYAEYLKVFDADYEKRSKLTKRLFYYRHTKGYNLERTKELIKEYSGFGDSDDCNLAEEPQEDAPLTARVDDLQKALEPNVMPNGFVWVIDKHFNKEVHMVDKHARIDMKTFLNALSYLPNIKGDITAKIIEDFFIPKKKDTDFDMILDAINAARKESTSYQRMTNEDINNLKGMLYKDMTGIKQLVSDMTAKLDMINSIKTMAEDMSAMSKAITTIGERLDALESAPKKTKTLRLVKKAEPILSDKDWKIKIREDIKKAAESYRKEHKGVPYSDSDVFNAVYSEIRITNNTRKTLTKKWKEETGKSNPSLLDLIAIDKDLRKNFEEILGKKVG